MRTSKLVVFAVASLINGLIIGGLLDSRITAAAHTAVGKASPAYIRIFAPIEVYPSPAQRAAFAPVDRGG